MLANVVLVIVGVVSAVLVGLVSRRVLGGPVGWPRSIIVGLLVFVCGSPFALWVGEQTGTVSNTDHTFESSSLIGIVVIVVSVAWIFALGVAVLAGLEVLLPTRPLVNPIDVVRGALAQRRRTQRYLQILEIASRHGAGFVFSGRSRRSSELSTAQQRANAVIATINASGVTFVKIGQVLSTRRDLVPEPYLSALASLQSSATTLPWPAIRAAVEAELGRPIAELFLHVDEEPLAAASVAQVHTATLLDGTSVVIKVQRPTARHQVEADVDIILRLARRAEEQTSQGRELRAESVARGFTTTLLDELDYTIEYNNTEMIRSTLMRIAEHHGTPGVTITVPTVYPEASSGRMITMDLVDGVPLSRASDRLALMTPELRHTLAVGLMNTVLEQILVYGVFHADLHPGNVILRENDTLGLIDFGAIGIIERSQRERLATLLLAASNEDDIAATDALLLIVDVPPDADIDSFRHDIGIVLTIVRHRAGGGGSIFTLMLDVIRQHHIALPATLASAFRSFATLEGCLRVLVPDFDMMGSALDRVPTLLLRMLSVKRIAATAQAQASNTAAYARTLPRRLNSLVSQLESGTLGVKVRHFSAPDDRLFVNAIVGEIVGTFVSVAAIVVSIVLVVVGSGPLLAPNLHLFDLLGAVIGLFGFLGVMRVVRNALVRRVGGR
ncbi:MULTISPECIES: ABC1 kinase family protein [Subtercola]|uniref:AarF/ABC1/UbiB kinase family protein n=1 Tax=Subtercola vilae TaxID=2056433 RepID=A0A4V4RH07_9MICO|nr:MULTISPECIES: AarF/UbiB family protein [Subtercola]MEA9985070.1 AarF/UbiB family protein [Subtercola sp. RTI3]TIH37094.1 AarF/ABC1/UbiB kinase family protein [Subtercola vilae]